MGAEFLGYVESTGSWTFQVLHFSKYGLNDSDEEADPQSSVQNSQKLTQLPSQNIVPGQDQLINQNLHIGLLGRPVALNGEQTVPKSLFFDPVYNEEDENMSHFSEPQFHLLDDLNQLNKSNLMSPSQSLRNFTVNTERLCGLKAALFEYDLMDDEDDFQGKFPESEPVRFDHKRRKEESAPLMPSNMPLVDGLRDLPVIQSAPIDSPFYQTPRKLTTSKPAFETLPYAKSLLFKKHHLILDAGCFSGLSFRVGWGPKMVILHKTPLESSSFQETAPKQSSLLPFTTPLKIQPPVVSLSTVRCSTLHVSSFSSSIFCTKENMLQNLQVQLSHNDISMNQNVPFVSPQDGVELLNSHFVVSREQASHGNSLQDVHTVWSLCSALWGHCPEEENPNSYNYHRFRKDLFSDWLISTSFLEMKKEVDNSNSHLAAMFSLLTGNCIAEASSKALEFNDLHLGLLLSQAGSFISVRSGILKQLENWFQFEVDHFIDVDRTKIFALLAGKLVWKTGQGTRINCCENLDWKRALSLHLWYHCLPTASIQEALHAYEESFQGSGPNGQYALPPYPPYIQSNIELQLLASQSNSSPFDMCYYLLKLYCDKSTPLGKMLVPLTYGSSQLDYSLSWMVHQVLLSLGYHHLPFAQSQLLHLNFASQLEAVGLWGWAVFVLLHIKEISIRKSLVMEVLIRHVSLKPNDEEQETESFLQEKLLIPSSWLFAAKAVLAKSSGDYKEEARCLLKSRQWTKSHQIIIEKIAPDCIIDEQFDYLKDFLTELANPQISSTILNWPTGGEVYLDYIHVSEKIEEMLSGQVLESEIEELHPRLISLSHRICNLQCLGAKDRLCQAEMSKKTVTLLRALFTLRKDIKSGMPGFSGSQFLTSLLPKLPMPEDYALQEMRATVRSYMLEVTSTERNCP